MLLDLDAELRTEKDIWLCQLHVQVTNPHSAIFDPGLSPRKA